MAIQTHGCKLNQADSAVLARTFANAGYTLVNSSRDADVFVLNTCTVTANADAKARQALRAARRSNPHALIVAAGCYPERSFVELERLDAVSLVVDNQHKHKLVSLVTARLGSDITVPLLNPDHASREKPSLRLGRSRTMIKIQEGCDQVCAYCIVPKVRGRERSIVPENLVSQINQAAAEGSQEVVLTGTQLGTYGFDIPESSLVRLLERILAETDIPRLRVSSLQPQEISPQLLQLWQDERLCPHFHVPLQSGSDTVLRQMRRRYDTAKYREAVDLIRATIPEVGITTDLIVGFPGEGAADFQDSYEFATSMAFSNMHIFPYSTRPGTSAAHLPDHTKEPEKKRRVALMMASAEQGFLAFRKHQFGQTRRVLWESSRIKGGSGMWSGLTEIYVRVRTESSKELGNTITNTLISRIVDGQVLADVL